VTSDKLERQVLGFISPLVTRHSKKNSRAKQRGTSKKLLEVCGALEDKSRAV
jgi:hypothetical protein